MDADSYGFWSISVFLLAVPALLVVSFSILWQFGKEKGRLPVYWACVHFVALCVAALLLSTNLREEPSTLVLLVIIAVYVWMAAIKISLDWWNAHRTKAAPPQ